MSINHIQYLGFKDFIPTQQWTADGPLVARDNSTGRTYRKADTSGGARVWYLIRALLVAPLLVIGGTLYGTACRIRDVVTLTPLWRPAPFGETHVWRHRFKDLAKEMLMIPGGVLAAIPLELSLFYMVFSPQNGAKTTDSWSRFMAEGVTEDPQFNFRNAPPHSSS